MPKPEIERIHIPTPYGAVIDYNEQTILIRRKWDDKVKPGDWKSDGYGSYLGIHIATLEHQGSNPCVSKAQAIANAEFIVKACNNHDELVAMLKESTAWVAKLIADRPEIDPTGVKNRAKKHLERLQDLIAQAEGME